MKRNPENDLARQASDAELEHTTEPAEPTSGERRTDLQFDEQANHDRDPWSRDDEREDALQCRSRGIRSRARGRADTRSGRGVSRAAEFLTSKTRRGASLYGSPREP